MRQRVRARAHRGLAVLFACSLSSASVETRAGTWTGGSTEWTQISNNIQLVMQLIEQVMMLKRLVEQVKMMKTMTKAEKAQASFQIMGGFASIIGGFARASFAGKSMYEQWKSSHAGEQGPEVAGHRNVGAAYDAMDKDLHAATAQTLKSLDIQVSESARLEDQQIAEQLKSRMDSAEGQMQAAQAANELLFEIVRQLNLLRQVTIAQARMTSVGLSEEAQRRLYQSQVTERDYKYKGSYRGRGTP